MLIKCTGCNEYMDCEICWCGEYIAKHGINESHSPVPMGCICYSFYKIGLLEDGDKF